MKIDVVIGNPPYQENQGGGRGNGAKAIYPHFIKLALALKPSYTTYIIPARWLVGGLGLDEFKAYMLSTPYIQELVYYKNGKDIFMGTSIQSGVCYILLNHAKQSKQVNITVYESKDNKPDKFTSLLDKYNLGICITDPVFDRVLGSIMHKQAEIDGNYLYKYILPVNYYKIPSSYRGELSSDIPNNNTQVLTSKGMYPIDNTLPDLDIKNKLHLKYKVYISRICNEHAGETDKYGRKMVLGSIGILGKQDICTESYVIIYETDNLSKAENLVSYLKTKFVRFILSNFAKGIHINRNTFIAIPFPDLSQSWNDNKLYKIYNIKEQDVSYIERHIKSKGGQ